jgi:hypothetical protein
MKDQNAPVTPDEVVLRLVWWTHYKPGLAACVREDAFEPKRHETDGISLFRAACLSGPSDALAAIAEEKRGLYAIAALPVADVFGLGLTVQPAPIEAVAGHAVVPELNILTFKAEKERWRKVMKLMAVIASRNVVHAPTD